MKVDAVVLLAVGVFLLYTGYRLMVLPYQSSDLWRLTLLMLLGAGGLLSLYEALYRAFGISRKPRLNVRIQKII